MTRAFGKHPARGFSLVELMIVVAILLVVAAVAIPQAIVATENFKLRGAVSGVASITQRARMLAVARNAVYPVLSTTTTTDGTATYVFVGSANDVAGSSTMSSTAEKTEFVQARKMVFDNSAAPSATAVIGGLTPVYSLPKFNARGLPCFVSATVCAPDASRQKMYIMFLRQDRTEGGDGWAAMAVLPSGRVQTWVWNGTAWQ